MPNIFFEQFPKIFSAAIASSLGVFALLACGIGALAWFFFRTGHWGVKMTAFVLLFFGVCGLGYSVFQKTRDVQAEQGVTRSDGNCKPADQTPAPSTAKLCGPGYVMIGKDSIDRTVCCSMQLSSTR
jgi:hypothetical protein